MSQEVARVIRKVEKVQTPVRGAGERYIMGRDTLIGHRVLWHWPREGRAGSQGSWLQVEQVCVRLLLLALVVGHAAPLLLPTHASVERLKIHVVL